MRAGDKIALFYTLLAVGVITAVAAIVCIIVAFCDARAHGFSSAGTVSLSFLMITLTSAVLIYFIGRRYARRMAESVEAAYQSEKAFISNASHELNNPLTAIQGECEISLMKERTPVEYQIALRRIAAETKRIILLMKQLRFLSHGEKEILQSATETIFLADFLMKFVGNRIRFTTDTFAYTLEANPHMLKIAIGNILNNACKYSGEKTVEMSLIGSRLMIEDHGIGIPYEEVRRIYQPFYRASNARAFAGHGVGLSLSIRILNTYGAAVDILSEVDKGTKVVIDFGV